MICSLWFYGIQLWGTAKSSDPKTLQAFQSICLRTITSTPWYIINYNLYKDFKILPINQLTKLHYSNIHSNLSSNPNLLIQQQSFLSLLDNALRRLRSLHFDLTIPNFLWNHFQNFKIVVNILPHLHIDIEPFDKTKSK